MKCTVIIEAKNCDEKYEAKKKEIQRILQKHINEEWYDGSYEVTVTD